MTDYLYITNSFAQMGPESLVFMIPILAIVGVIGSGMVTMFLKHQRQMTELLQKQQSGNPVLIAEVQALRAEVAELKDRFNTMAISSDRTSQTIPPAIPDPISERLNS